MIAVPAIDLMKGKVVRLERGRPDSRHTYGADPVEMAARCERAGAQRLHVVDLDRALGVGDHLAAVGEILREVSIPVQVGGGIRSAREASALLEMEADRVILSTALFGDGGADLAGELASEITAGKVAASLDDQAGCLRVQGWTCGGLDLEQALDWIRQTGFTCAVYTAVGRDGTLMGSQWPPCLPLDSMDMYLAGGISSVDDLVRAQEAGFRGAIVGRALYEGQVDLSQARSILSRREVPGVVPCLDIRGEQVVKGTRFQNLRVMGDPVRLAERYGKNGSSRLAMLFIEPISIDSASSLIGRVARAAAGTPLLAGGGIDCLERAQAYLQAGASFVSVGSAAVEKPDLMPALLRTLGAERVVLAVDVARRGRKLEVMLKGGREPSGVGLEKLLGDLGKAGLEEAMVTSVDQDGTGDGYDLDSIRRARERVPWVIASGGGGSLVHMAQALGAGASQVLAASIFHQGGFLPGEVRCQLQGGDFFEAS